jgi:hypothetical protein
VKSFALCLTCLRRGEPTLQRGWQQVLAWVLWPALGVIVLAVAIVTIRAWLAR